MFVSVVCSQVSSDHISTTSTVRTRRTLVRFFSCVCPLVCGQVVRSAEYLTTDSTTVWFVACVESHVTGQHVTSGKGSLTNLYKQTSITIYNLQKYFTSQRYALEFELVLESVERDYNSIKCQ